MGHWYGDSSHCHTVGGVPTDIHWLEAIDAAKHLATQRTAPYYKELSGPKCQ